MELRRYEKSPATIYRCYRCQGVVTPGSDCQTQGRKTHPSFICNPCNRRDQKLNGILRDDEDLAHDFENLPKEKQAELRESFLEKTKQSIQEGLRAAISFNKEVKRTERKGDQIDD